MSVPRSSSQAFKVSDKSNVWQPTAYTSELNALLYLFLTSLLEKHKSSHISNINPVIVEEKVSRLLMNAANKSNGNRIYWVAIFKWEYNSR